MASSSDDDPDLPTPYKESLKRGEELSFARVPVVPRSLSDSLITLELAHRNDQAVLPDLIPPTNSPPPSTEIPTSNAMTEPQEFQHFDTGHADRVVALDINFNDTRSLTGSIDHRIKIWDHGKADGERKLVETFTAHGASIRDVS